MTSEVEVERNWEFEAVVADDDELESGLGDNKDNMSYELFIY